MASRPILEKQLAKLVRGAPDPPSAFACQTIGAVLVATAEKLTHTHYFLVTDRASQWQLVTLNNVQAPEQYKTVIYAFADSTTANIERLQSGAQELLCQRLPVIEILWRALPLNKVDSLIFFEEKFQNDRGKEINIPQLYRKCQQYLGQNSTIV
jgi:hypothetical protein